MNTGRVGAILSAAVALISFALALNEMEGSMIVTSFLVLVFGIIASKHCPPNMNRLILIASFVTLICTIVTATVLSQSLVQKDTDYEFVWFYLIAFVHAIPLVPLTFSAFVITASVSGASYNWAVVRGLSPFVAMGMQVPGYVVEYLDTNIVDNGYILYGLLMMFAIMVVCGALFSHYMRKNKILINENGLVVQG